jgi:AcrR family transcriptional regulator
MDCHRLAMGGGHTGSNMDSVHTWCNMDDVYMRRAIARPTGPKRKRPLREPYHHGDLRRALLHAALALLAERQDWNFSLREVARWADVSHNAPYNHFADKRALLDAVAACGFTTLADRMKKASRNIERADAALAAAALAYVRLGADNPAHYRLMFGSVLAGPDGARPPLANAAGAEAKAVLKEILARGAEQGCLAIAPGSKAELELAVLSAWSTVHGLTMLVIDGLAAGRPLTVEAKVARVVHTLFEGLRTR